MTFNPQVHLEILPVENNYTELMTRKLEDFAPYINVEIYAVFQFNKYFFQDSVSKDPAHLAICARQVPGYSIIPPLNLE